MDQNYYFGIVILLMGIAALDLIVGVANDAVNFLNSSIGSRVASRKTIFLVASIGLFAGVLFSSGMMEVARKGIFNPQFFTMPDLMMIFIAVMIADLIILDIFNTYGLPTSTTVSIVFELLGAAVILSVLKILAAEQSLTLLGDYINSAKALGIISGILLSVLISFVFGALAQFIARLLFTFQYEKYLNLFGGLWSGLCLASITLFILMKGAKGAPFISAEMSQYINTNLQQIFLGTWLLSGICFQILVSLFKVNIFKPVVLLGTFSLALAFAANDLVNFVGVPIASFHAYTAAFQSSDPLTVPMSMLAGQVPSTTWLLMLCGVVMVFALWFSKKAQSVTETEIRLSNQDEGDERFESLAISRVIVRLFMGLFAGLRYIFPRSLRKFVKRRLARNQTELDSTAEVLPSFDLLRASTNLMMATVLVSFATSLKLPLSTTYVTFMVAMGTSFADQAWGRETAVYRVTGVLTVIGGWFITALMAFATAGAFCALLYFAGTFGGVLLLLMTGFFLWRTHGAHRDRVTELDREEVFNLRKITDAKEARAVTFKQAAILLREMRMHLEGGIQAFFREDRSALRFHYQSRKKLSRWSSIIAANVFKVMRLSYKQLPDSYHEYSQTVSCLQGLAEVYRDVLRRTYYHVRENHKGLLSIQRQELEQIAREALRLLEMVEGHIAGEALLDLKMFEKERESLDNFIREFSALQNERIHNHSSKTRLSLLYFALCDDFKRLVDHVIRIQEIAQMVQSDLRSAKQKQHKDQVSL